MTDVQQKSRNKSPQQKSTCVIRVRSSCGWRVYPVSTLTRRSDVGRGNPSTPLCMDSIWLWAQTEKWAASFVERVHISKIVRVCTTVVTLGIGQTTTTTTRSSSSSSSSSRGFTTMRYINLSFTYLLTYLLVVVVVVVISINFNRTAEYYRNAANKRAPLSDCLLITMTPRRGVRSIAISVSVCLSVCLPVCPASVSQKLHVQISQNFLYVLPVAVARSSSDDNAICYVYTSGFVDDVTFSLNRVLCGVRRGLRPRMSVSRDGRSFSFVPVCFASRWLTSLGRKPRRESLTVCRWTVSCARGRSLLSSSVSLFLAKKVQDLL